MYCFGPRLFPIHLIISLLKSISFDLLCALPVAHSQSQLVSDSDTGQPHYASMINLALPVLSGEKSILKTLLVFITKDMKYSPYRLRDEYHLNRTTLYSIKKGVVPSRNVEFYFRIFLSIIAQQIVILIEMGKIKKPVLMMCFLIRIFFELIGVEIEIKPPKLPDD